MENAIFGKCAVWEELISK